MVVVAVLWLLVEELLVPPVVVVMLGVVDRRDSAKLVAWKASNGPSGIRSILYKAVR